ncbi:hypothetical protein V5S96_03815 [Corynebacterium mastitidis]|uniref:Major facilitator superfamily (MFS) profile domain-containing protein n=1 Tax=Corynebacterium mastitidis TaxID=161890 RepID=A0ABU8NX92_9CORY
MVLVVPRGEFKKSQPLVKNNSFDMFGQLGTVFCLGAIFSAISILRVGYLFAGSFLLLLACSVVMVLVMRKPGENRLLDRETFGTPLRVLYSVAPVLFSLGFWCLLVSVPAIATDTLLLSPVQAGLLVAPLGLGLFAAGIIPTPLSRVSSIATRFSICFVGMGVFFLCGSLVHNTVLVVLCMVCASFFAGWLNPDVARAYIQVSPVDRAGTAAGISSTMRQLGFGAGIVFLGVSATPGEASSLHGALGYILTFSSMICFLAALIFFVYSIRTRNS